MGSGQLVRRKQKHWQISSTCPLNYLSNDYKQRLMHKYQITIYWDREDQVYVAEVPELPGCMAHGDTHELALANANEAIQLWIDTANEFGDPVPEPRGQRLMLA